VKIGVSVVAVVKAERLALTVVVTLCQCREMVVKEEQTMAIKLCCKVHFSATKTVKLIQKAYGDAELSRKTIMLAVYALCRKEANLLAAVAVIEFMIGTIRNENSERAMELQMAMYLCISQRSTS
jgi:hypothetical protein